MYVYHLDRAHSLNEGQILDLVDLTCVYGDEKLVNLLGDKFNDFSFTLKNAGFSKVTRFINGMASRPIIDKEFRDTINIEKNFEIIRKASFPTMLSRYTSMFGVLKLDDIQKWGTFFGYNNSPIWLIECETRSPILDARFLRSFKKITPEVIDMAFKYWNGFKSDDPLPEVLFSLPAKVVCQAGIL